MGLRKGPVFTNLGQTLADGRELRVVDVDVGAWPGVLLFARLVAVAFLQLAEADLNRLLLQQPRLDVIALLFLDLVLTRSWVGQVRLLGEGGVQFVFPEVTPHGRAHERVQILSACRTHTGSEFRIVDRGVHGARITCGSGRENIRIVARTWLVVFDLRIFAVGHFGEEDAGSAERIERLFRGWLLHLVVTSRPRVFSRRVLLVLNVNRRFKHLASGFRRLEVTDRSTALRVFHVWIVERWSDCVEATARVHVLIHFL